MFFTRGRIKFNKQFFFIVMSAGFAPPIFMTIAILLGDQTTEREIEDLISGFGYSLIYTTVISIVVANAWNVIDKRFPWSRSPTKRILVEIITSLPLAICVMLILTWIDVNVVNVKSPDEHLAMYRKNILITIVMNTFILFVFEAIFIFERWKASELENERLEKESINTQFASLRNQVNPHFLFNSLNSLSALIHEDADRAEHFVDELSKVYRYVLEVKDHDLVPLSVELDFIESFLHIQKIRFGKNLNYSSLVSNELLDKMVPPLSLQLLVENSIKHNKISSRFPLTIIIKEENGWLEIVNTLQAREEEIDSTGVGLNNLRARYKKFTDKDLVFKAQGEEYIAKIPLLNQETWMF